MNQVRQSRQLIASLNKLVRFEKFLFKYKSVQNTYFFIFEIK
jgi:hypothetical protein